MIFHLLHETNKEIAQQNLSGIFSEKYYRYADERIANCNIWYYYFAQCQNLNLTSIYEIKSINWCKYACTYNQCI